MQQSLKHEFTALKQPPNSQSRITDVQQTNLQQLCNAIMSTWLLNCLILGKCWG